MAEETEEARKKIKTGMARRELEKAEQLVKVRKRRGMTAKSIAKAEKKLRQVKARQEGRL